jgi:hypothetical protein
MSLNDSEAFKKWFYKIENAPYKLHVGLDDEYFKVWMAALEYERDRFKPINIGLGKELIAERERSKILIDALERIAANFSEDYRYGAYQAILKYKGEV